MTLATHRNRPFIVLAVIAALAVLAVFTAAQAQLLPKKPLKPPLPSQADPTLPATKGDQPTAPRESVEQKRLKATPDPRRNESEVLPPPADEDADNPHATYNGAVAAVDLKDKEVQVKFGEEEFFSVLVGPKTEILIDSKPAKLADLKTTDPIIVTTMKDDTAEKMLAVKLAIVRLKRTSEPTEEPSLPREDAIRQIDHAVALGAICVPTPDKSVLVVAVDRDSPADRVGIRTGDFILEINGEAPQDILLRGDLVYFVQDPKSGLTCNVVVWRAGKEYATELVIIDVEVAPKALPLTVIDEVTGRTVGVGGTTIGGAVVGGGGGVVGGGGVIGGGTFIDDDAFLDLERRALDLKGDAGTRALIRELLDHSQQLRGQLNPGTQSQPEAQPGTQPGSQPGTQPAAQPRGARYQTQPGVPPKGARYQTQPGVPPKGKRYQTQPSTPSGGDASGTQPGQPSTQPAQSGTQPQPSP